MEIAFAFLADAATAPGDGKIYVLGGGINVLGAAAFPFTHHAMTLVVCLSVHPTESDQLHSLEIELWDADGTQVGPKVSGQFGAQRHPEHPSWKIMVPVALTYANTVFPRPGDFEFQIGVDGRHLHTLDLHVVPMAAPPTSS
ncbi:MAG: hypothetical protein NVS4B8_18270 [Herpetosiphon sp.]